VTGTERPGRSSREADRLRVFSEAGNLSRDQRAQFRWAVHAAQGFLDRCQGRFIERGERFRT
jgi:hypothetical protein